MSKNPNDLNDQLASGFKVLGPKVLPEFADERLDRYLGGRFPFFSRQVWIQRIRDHQVLVNCKQVRPSQRLQPGDKIFMYHPESVEPEVNTEISLVFEQSGVMGVYKPPGLPMHEGGAFRKRTFANIVKERFGREWSAIHRLDKETSGIVLCGATESLRQKLSKQIEKGEMRKEYSAIVHGVPAKESWFMDGSIGKAENSRIRIKNWIVSEGGLTALTEFSCEESIPNYARIVAYPRTGRTNQIRIHAAASGHALVGDKLFYPDEEVFLDYFENGMSPRIAEITGHWRCCLHARAISFCHPEIGTSLRAEIAEPEDFLDVWRNLSGYDGLNEINRGESSCG